MSKRRFFSTLDNLKNKSPNNPLRAIQSHETRLQSQENKDVEADALEEFSIDGGDLDIDVIMQDDASTAAEPTDAGFTGSFQSQTGIDFGGVRYNFGGIVAGFLQWGASLVGKLYAGAGAVVLDEDGITIVGGVGLENYLKFISIGDVPLLYISAIPVTSTATVVIDANPTYPSGSDGSLTLQASAATGRTGSIHLRTEENGSPTNEVLINNTEVKINVNSADRDTSIYGTAATPVIKVDAGNNTLAVNGGAEISALTHGTYTPSLTNTTNITSSAASVCQYMRVGNVVTVSGVVTIDPTAAGAAELRMTLPIASAFAANRQCGGVATSASVAGVVIAILADTATQKASFQWIVVDTVNRNYFFTFTYLVL